MQEAREEALDVDMKAVYDAIADNAKT